MLQISKSIVYSWFMKRQCSNLFISSFFFVVTFLLSGCCDKGTCEYTVLYDNTLDMDVRIIAYSHFYKEVEAWTLDVPSKAMKRIVLTGVSPVFPMEDIFMMDFVFEDGKKVRFYECLSEPSLEADYVNPVNGYCYKSVSGKGKLVYFKIQEQHYSQDSGSQSEQRDD